MALTFGLLQQGCNAVHVRGCLAQLHQGQEERLQGGVQGLEQGEAQAQALDGHVCGAQGPVKLGSQPGEAETPSVNRLRWSLPLGRTASSGAFQVEPGGSTVDFSPKVPETKGETQAGRWEALAPKESKVSPAHL